MEVRRSQLWTSVEDDNTKKQWRRGQRGVGGRWSFSQFFHASHNQKDEAGKVTALRKFQKKKEKKEKLFGALLVAVLVVPEIVMINPIELHSIKSGAC